MPLRTYTATHEPTQAKIIAYQSSFIFSYCLVGLQNPIVQQYDKPTASIDWGLIYVLGSPDSAGLSSNLPLIVHQCHSEWMEPFISVRGSEGVASSITPPLLSVTICKRSPYSKCRCLSFQDQSGYCSYM